MKRLLLYLVVVVSVALGVGLGVRSVDDTRSAIDRTESILQQQSSSDKFELVLHTTAATQPQQVRICERGAVSNPHTSSPTLRFGQLRRAVLTPLPRTAPAFLRFAIFEVRSTKEYFLFTLRHIII